LEEPMGLSETELEIQQIAFQHHHERGTLSWRYLAPKIATSLAKLDDPYFHFANLATIAPADPEQLYTDYCHLTAKGNQIVAERLYPVVANMLGLTLAPPESGEQPKMPEGQSFLAGGPVLSGVL
jgi:hypothetical protein